MPTRTADFPAGRLEHARLPPHDATGFTSESAPFAIGVSFTGHLGAVVRHEHDPSRTLDLGPGTVGINGPRPLSWLRVHGDPWAIHALAELAAVVHLSPFHFLRAFKSLVGLTPHQYVVAVRSEHLNRLLEADGATVASVAGRVGIDVRQARRLLRRQGTPSTG